MNDVSTELVIVIVVLIGAVSYTAWRFYQVLKAKESPCEHCELKKNCKKFGQSKEK